MVIRAWWVIAYGSTPPYKKVHEYYSCDAEWRVLVVMRVERVGFVGSWLMIAGVNCAVI